MTHPDDAQTNPQALVEAILKIRPPKSETFPYQADGYAAGWHAALDAYRNEIRTALSPARKQIAEKS